MEGADDPIRVLAPAATGAVARCQRKVAGFLSVGVKLLNPRAFVIKDDKYDRSQVLAL
jgi:hypothetical protein